jgi:hypothetical protein
VNINRQDWKHCASITYLIRHYVSPKGTGDLDHSHNAEKRSIELILIG